MVFRRVKEDPGQRNRDVHLASSRIDFNVNFRWYINRMRAMSRAEIVHRIREQGKRGAWRFYKGGWTQFSVEDGTIPIAPHLGYQLDAAVDRSLALRDRIAQEAGAILSGNMSLLGCRWPDGTLADLTLADTGLFLRDPLSGKCWPSADSYCFDVPHAGEGLGDIKYLWELNRLQFLQVLAAHARLTRDKTLAAKIIDVILAWMDVNPPFRGPNWCSGIELSMRLSTLVIVLSFIGKVDDHDKRMRLRAFLYAHVFWLDRYPSLYSSANNHRIAEAFALFLIGTLVPDLTGAKRLATHGAEILEQEIRAQIFDDGFGVEQSPTYTAFSLEMFATADLIGRSVGHSFSSFYQDRLSSAAECLSWQMDSSGRVPAIGDNDEGRVIVLTCHPEKHYVASVVACITALIERSDAMSQWSAPELRDGLFGVTMTTATNRIESGLRVFGSGGYTVIRDSYAGYQSVLVFDHGPLGFKSIAAHGHADALAIWLQIADIPIFVDAGTFLYHSGGRWRDIFRSTAAHNTLTVEGESSSIVAGPFNWKSKARARLVACSTAPLWSVEAAHDGYAARFGVHHHRRMTRSASGFDVTDSLIGPGPPRPVAIRFLLAPELTAVLTGNTWLIRLPNGLIVRIAGPDGFEVTKSRGDEVSGAGWISESFGARRPTEQLVFHGSLGAGTTRVSIDH
jgi:hypothetical protein